MIGRRQFDTRLLSGHPKTLVAGLLAGLCPEREEILLPEKLRQLLQVRAESERGLSALPKRHTTRLVRQPGQASLPVIDQKEVAAELAGSAGKQRVDGDAVPVSVVNRLLQVDVQGGK